MTNQVATNNNQHAMAFGLGLVFFVVVLFGFISAAWWLSQQVFGQEKAPVSTVTINGEMPYTQRQDVMSAIAQVDLGNFFEVDVNAIQEKVSALPWVYSVAVRKQWPDELKIYVVDQTPIALWNGDFLLNQFGKAFQADTSRLTQTLPQFFGPEGSELLALENYSNLNELLAYNSLAIDELVLSERFSWQLTLNDGVMLNLGREERVERIQRFMDVYPLIKSHIQEKSTGKNNQKNPLKQAVDYIDLRYDTGLAVGWKSVANLSSNKWQKTTKTTCCDEKINTDVLNSIKKEFTLHV